MVKITATVLTYNEEKRIENVLKGLTSFDSVIVIDKSSTDSTREIAQKYGAKVVKVPYYNDTTPVEVLKTVKNAFYTFQDNEWILGLTCSDIVHHELYSVLTHNIEEYGDNFSVFEIPLFCYSMGQTGKHSYFGGVSYRPLLYRRELMSETETVVHTSSLEAFTKYRIRSKDEKVAIYHLTHSKLDLVMDRHWRYAVQYVIDGEKLQGRTRKRMMKYAIKEMFLTCLTYIKKRMFKLKWDGAAQCIMIIMYNAMIFLNAYFDEEKEKEIDEKYIQIVNECEGESNEAAK